MNHTFKNHQLSEGEKLWLKEVYESDEFDPRIAKVKLHERLPKDFDPREIDQRFLLDAKNLSLIGVWHVDAESVILKHVETVILAIKDLIIKKPGIEFVTAKEIAQNTGLEEYQAEIALRYISGLGRFFSSASGSSDGKGYSKITITGDADYDAYLNFDNLDDLMEEYYQKWSETSNGTIVLSPPHIASTIPGSSYVGLGYYAPFEFAKSEIKRNMAFVLMAMDPDNAELADIYHAIKDVCSSFDIKAYRADEIEHQDRITDRILLEIKTCEFLIADVTHERPNVYYEIGYAHAMSKRPILYRKKGTKLHFDLLVHNVPEYKNITELRELLNKRFEAILGRSSK